MDERQGRLDTTIREISVVHGKVRGQHHALVGDRPRRHRDDVEPASLHQFRSTFFQLDVSLFSDHEEFALEIVCVSDVFASRDEELAYHGLDQLYAFTEARRVHRNVAPSEQFLTLLDHQLCKQVLANDPIGRVLGQEHHPNAVVTSLGEVDTLFKQFWSKEPVRYLEQHSGAITRQRISTNRTSVGEICEYGQTLVDDLVTLAAFDVGDEPYATRVVVEPTVVEAFCLLVFMV